MPKTVFYYFPAKAMGEPVRLLLAYGGEEFEDKRVKMEDWPSVKPSMPFGQMPVLEIEGKKYAQSIAIARYLGHKHHLAGDCLEEALEIDQNVDYLNDLRNEASSVYYEQDEAIKAKKHEENVQAEYPNSLDKLDDIFKKNNGHLATGKLTWGDFVFAGVFDYLKVMLRMPDLEQRYPSFKQVIDNVYAVPTVKAYKATSFSLVARLFNDFTLKRTMPKIAVYYFPLKALGEGIRLLLAYGGEEFEDCRITKEEWADVKPTMPFGQMPILEIDGKKYAQSSAIVRYLGRKYGLVGKNIEEDFEIDQNIEFFTDIRTKAGSVFHEQDEKVKASKQAELEKNYYPVALKKLDEIITKNKGHMAIGKLTWADFLFAGMYDCLKTILQMPDLDEKYPSFKKLQETVLAIPKVKAFCDKAPKSPY
ncbi:jg3690 [Pararge aegeria aegeria]|uniref:glutathione transferase n=2 Tax=Pararge aegeria TaxID=116150 RepID=A0A8S4S5X0_9NEOP|nr:jg3690 [Pararge aegeria aegeria]